MAVKPVKVLTDLLTKKQIIKQDIDGNVLFRVTGSQTDGFVLVTIPLTASAGIEGRLYGTASYALTAAYAENGGGGGISSVYTTGNITGSGLLANPVALKDPLIIGTITASYGFNGNLFGTASYTINAATASYAQNAISSSYALTASFAQNSGLNSVYTSGSITGSGLVTDPVRLQDPLIIGSITASNGFNGRLYGTASYALDAVSSSFAIIAATASTLTSFVQSDYLTTASFNQFSSSYNTGSFSGSLNGTASYALNATTASYVLNAVSASFATSASYSVTASFAQNATTASYSLNSDKLDGIDSSGFAILTASNIFTNNQIISGNLDVAGTVTAQQLSITYVTSSVLYTSGSTKFGDTLDDTHQFTGSLFVTGNVTANNFIGTASYATNAKTASFLTGFNQNDYVTTASFNQFTSSYNTGSFSGSLIGTASYALNATSASFATTASYADNALSSSYATTSSYSVNALSASYATTASYAGNALSASHATTSSYAFTASVATSASYLGGIPSDGYAILTASNIFTNSNIISGNLFVTGGLSVGDYVQLLPVAVTNIPANLTASYIYTSGSTNDMYFTQYQGPYTNTTRLRWLEGALNTGLLNGGTLSTVNGTNKFNVASGAGIIVNYNASTTTDPYPTIKYVQWTSSVSQSLQFSSSAQITYVAIDSNGEISQTTIAPTALNFKDRIVLGRILHQSGSVTNGTISSPATAYAVNSNNADFIRSIGPLKVSGHLLEASGSTLSLKKTAGDSYVEGRNYVVNPNVPNYISAADDPAVTISKIYREHVSGSTPIIDTGIGNAGYTTVDPTLYNNNGTLTAVGGGNYSVQRVYWFPRSVNRALFVYYGNASYGTVNEAIAAVSTENFIEGDNTRGAAIFVAYLVLKGNASNLTNTSQALIIQAGVLRGSVAGGGATAGVGATNLASLTDVLIGTPTIGQALVWNGTKWVDGTPLNATSASYATNALTASHITDGATTSIQNAYSRLRYQTVGNFDVTGSATIMLPSSSLGGYAFPTGSFNYIDVSVTVKQNGRWINDLLSVQMYTSSTNVYIELSAPALTSTDQYKVLAVNENPSDYVL
jgi:hypothetical protein